MRFLFKQLMASQKMMGDAMSKLSCLKANEDGTILVRTARAFNEDTQQATWRLSVTASIDATVNGEFEREISKLGGEVAFTGAHLMHLLNKIDEHAGEIQLLAQWNIRDMMEKLADEEK